MVNGECLKLYFFSAAFFPIWFNNVVVQSPPYDCTLIVCHTITITSLLVVGRSPPTSVLPPPYALILTPLLLLASCCCAGALPRSSFVRRCAVRLRKYSPVFSIFFCEEWNIDMISHRSDRGVLRRAGGWGMSGSCSVFLVVIGSCVRVKNF